MQIGQTAVFSADDRMIGGAPPWEFYKLYRNPAKQFLNIIAISGENVKLVKIGAIFFDRFVKIVKSGGIAWFFRHFATDPAHTCKQKQKNFL